MLPYLRELIDFYKCLTNYEFCQIEDAIYVIDFNLNYIREQYIKTLIKN